MTSSDSHLLLGLSPPVTRIQIMEARRRLSLLHHPDRGGDAALMARINQAADDLLTSLTQDGAATAAPTVPNSGRVPRTIVVDHPSFVIDVLPVEAHEALSLAVLSIGEIMEDEPPYVVEFVLTDVDGSGDRVWCRAEIVPDAGSSTVSLTSDLSHPDQIERIRDLIVREINSLDARS